MYTSFFGFKCKPFQLAPDPEFLFLSSVHRRALTYLNYGIKDNYGFILLTGEIGTGKTTIIRTLLKQIPHEIRVARVTNTKVTSKQLISMISEDFGLATKNKDKTRMLSDLTDFLINQCAMGGRSVLIIDEAQNLTVDLLEEVRLLSNLETDKSNLLQIILIGQPELNITLSKPELEQLRQRIAINVYVRCLAREELDNYIKHRLKVAGNKDSVRFEDGVMDVIYEFSHGVPRLINIVCEFALLTAFADKKRVVELEVVKEIIEDFINESPVMRSAATKAQRPPEQDPTGKIQESLSSIQLRLQNLESALFDIKNKISHDESNNATSQINEDNFDIKPVWENI